MSKGRSSASLAGPPTTRSWGSTIAATLKTLLPFDFTSSADGGTSATAAVPGAVPTSQDTAMSADSVHDSATAESRTDTADSDSALALLQCSLCLSTFGDITDPTTALCGHNFCKGCLSSWIVTQTNKGTAPVCPLCRQIIQASPALLRTNLDLQAALRSRSSSSSSSNLSSGYTSGSSSGCDGSVLRISNNISSSGSSSSSSSFRSSCASKQFLKKLQPSSASASASPAATNAAASLWSSTLLLALLVLFSAVAFSRLDGPAAARIRVVARPPSRDDQGLCAVYAKADEVTGSRGSGGSSGNLNFLSAAASNYEHSSSSSGGGSGSGGGDMRAYAGVGGAGVNTFDALAGAHMTQPPPPPPTPPRRVPAAKMLALLRSLSPSPQFRQADATATTTSAERSLPSVPTGASPALAHSSNTATAAAAVSTITAALRHHGRNGAVVREACAALRRSVLDDADARDAFAKGHGVGLVVALLRPSNGYIANFNLGVGAPPTNAAAALVYEVAATLKALTWHADTLGAFISAGGPALLLPLLSRVIPHYPAVAVEVAGALGNVARVYAFEHSDAHTAAAMLVRLLRSHSSETQAGPTTSNWSGRSSTSTSDGDASVRKAVEVEVCWALRTLAWSDVGKDAIYATSDASAPVAAGGNDSSSSSSGGNSAIGGAMPALLAILGRHGQHPGVLSISSTALANLVSTSRGVELFVKSGGMEVVSVLLQAHGRTINNSSGGYGATSDSQLQLERRSSVESLIGLSPLLAVLATATTSISACASYPAAPPATSTISGHAFASPHAPSSTTSSSGTCRPHLALGASAVPALVRALRVIADDAPSTFADVEFLLDALTAFLEPSTDVSQSCCSSSGAGGGAKENPMPNFNFSGSSSGAGSEHELPVLSPALQLQAHGGVTALVTLLSQYSLHARSVQAVADLVAVLSRAPHPHAAAGNSDFRAAADFNLDHGDEGGNPHANNFNLGHRVTPSATEFVTAGGAEALATQLTRAVGEYVHAVAQQQQQQLRQTAPATQQQHAVHAHAQLRDPQLRSTLTSLLTAVARIVATQSDEKEAGASVRLWHTGNAVPALLRTLHAFSTPTLLQVEVVGATGAQVEAAGNDGDGTVLSSACAALSSIVRAARDVTASTSSIMRVVGVADEHSPAADADAHISSRRPLHAIARDLATRTSTSTSAGTAAADRDSTSAAPARMPLAVACPVIGSLAVTARGDMMWLPDA